jgi:hypothetical protein
VFQPAPVRPPLVQALLNDNYTTLLVNNVLKLLKALPSVVSWCGKS